MPNSARDIAESILKFIGHWIKAKLSANLDKNRPEKKVVDWFWANLKGETKSDIPTQCCPPPGGPKVGAKRSFANNSKSKRNKKKVSNKSCG